MATAGDSSNPITPKPTTKKRKPRKPKLAAATAQHVISILNTASSAAHTFLSQNDLHLLPSQSLQLESLLSSLPPPFFQLPSQPSFFHRFASSATLDFDQRWVQFFSVSRPNFYRLLSLLSPSLVIFLPSTIPPETALASASPTARVIKLWRVNLVWIPLRRPALRFYSVCKAVNDKLGDLFEFRRDLERIVVGFGWISLPNCCGALGFGRFGVDGEIFVAHSLAMELVSTAFGRVKARWQLLARSWKEDSLEFFPFVIVMGCVLHNFLIKWGEPLPEESEGGCLKEEELLVFEGEGDETGQTIRDALAQHLSLASMRK